MTSVTYLCLFLGLLIAQAEGSGKLLVKLISFDNPGGEGDNGNCCDGRWPFCETRGCDHKFTVCVDNFYGSSSMNSCPLGNKITGTIDNHNYIDFAETIGGTINPLTYSFVRWQLGVKLKVQIDDNDYGGNSDDYVDTVITRFARKPARNAASATWRRHSLSDRTTLMVDVKEFCDPYWSGDNCDVYCKASHGGGHYECNPRTGAKICHPGWQGRNCDVQVNECASSPCQNGASCDDALNSYTCSCLDGYQGAHCETDVDECAGAPCRHGATCVNSPGSFICSCRNGFTGDLCEVDIDECARGPCENDGTCVDREGDYECTCLGGYTGHNCQTETRECDSNPCLNNGTCSEMVNEYNCTCLLGFTGVNCQINIDDCLSSPCFGEFSQCIDLVNAYECACPKGFTGSHCENDTDECASGPCLNNGSCVDLPGNFSCLCEAGWTGYVCERDVDECASSPCPANQTCVDDINNFHCVCLPGWNGSACGEDIDECLTQPCGEYGECSNTPGNYSCACVPGWTGNHCEVKMDPCWSQPCANNGSCISGANDTVSCNCTRDWTGDRCQLLVDDCSVTPCENSGSGDDQGAVGHCPDGWFGTDCQHKSQCQTVVCQNRGVCEDSVAGPSCTCPPGYTGRLCESPHGDCLLYPCYNNGTCVSGIVCQCAEGFSGHYCEDVVFDPCESSPCLNGGTCFYDPTRNYTCACPEHFSGPTCSMSDNATATTTKPVMRAQESAFILSGILKEGHFSLIENRLRFVIAEHLKTKLANVDIVVDVSECFSEQGNPMSILLVTVLDDGNLVYADVISEVFARMSDEDFQNLFPLPVNEGEDCMPPTMAAQKGEESGAVMYTIIGMFGLLLVAAVVIIIIAIKRKRTSRKYVTVVKRKSEDLLGRMSPLYRHYRESGVVLPPSPAGQTITVNPTFSPDNQPQQYEPFFTAIDARDEEPLMGAEGQDVMVPHSQSDPDPEGGPGDDKPKLKLDLTKCNIEWIDHVSNENLYESPRINYNE